MYRGRQRFQGSLIDSRYFPWAPSVAEEINRFVLNDINLVPRISRLAILNDKLSLSGLSDFRWIFINGDQFFFFFFKGRVNFGKFKSYESWTDDNFQRNIVQHQKLRLDFVSCHLNSNRLNNQYDDAFRLVLVWFFLISTKLVGLELFWKKSWNLLKR